MEEKQSSRPLSDVVAHERAMSLPIGQVVKLLVELLGATTVAFIGGVGETLAVQQWLAGRSPQRQHILRFALQLAAIIAAKSDNTQTVRAWFHGSNPYLKDAIPASLLREEPLEKIQLDLMRAARAFAARTQDESRV